MTIKREALIAGLMCSLLVSLIGCSDYGRPAQPYPVDPPPAVVPVQGVRVTPQSVVLDIGETRQLLATVAPLDATDQALTWESSDSAVAAVSPSGVVTARAPGAGVFITAYTHDGGRQSTANVTVSPAAPPPAFVPVQGVRVTPQTVVLAVGETRQLLATIAPLDATDQALTWESSDTAVVTVSASGVVTARASGAGVFVTTYTHDGDRQSSANVTVSP